MKLVSFFHKETGLLNGVHVSASDESAIEANTPVDHIAIDGHHDHLSKRVDLATEQVVEYQPPSPSADHEWNDESKRWSLKKEVQTRIDARVVALMKITQLEAKHPRLTREWMLGDKKAEKTLQEIEDQIIELRKNL